MQRKYSRILVTRYSSKGPLGQTHTCQLMSGRRTHTVFTGREAHTTGPKGYLWDARGQRRASTRSSRRARDRVDPRAEPVKARSDVNHAPEPQFYAPTIFLRPKGRTYTIHRFLRSTMQICSGTVPVRLAIFYAARSGRTQARSLPVTTSITSVSMRSVA